jgi:pimeloyl-ACP methyl ester carboxylesterase
MAALRALLLAIVVTQLAAAQQAISFPTRDGARICADLYGKNDRGVVLAHGGRFTKEIWRDQALALVSAGFRVLAIDFRGFGCSTGPGPADIDNPAYENDVLAAVRYLKAHGVNRYRWWGAVSVAVLPAMHPSNPDRVRLIAPSFWVRRQTCRQKS